MIINKLTPQNDRMFSEKFVRKEDFLSKVCITPVSGAYFIHTRPLIKFFRSSFIYEKPWKSLDNCTITNLKKSWLKIFQKGGDNVCG